MVPVGSDRERRGVILGRPLLQSGPTYGHVPQGLRGYLILGGTGLWEYQPSTLLSILKSPFPVDQALKLKTYIEETVS